MFFKKFKPAAFAFIAFFCSAFVTEAYLDRAIAGVEKNLDEFKSLAAEKYNDLKKLLPKDSSSEAIESFAESNFDLSYIASNACKKNLSKDEAAGLAPYIKKFSRFLFKGEAIQKVISLDINTEKMIVTPKKKLTFVDCELSDGTKFKAVFLPNKKLVDLSCLGISVLGTLDAVVSKYCNLKKINFQSKENAGRVDLIKSAVNWHIEGQPQN